MKLRLFCKPEKPKKNLKTKRPAKQAFKDIN
jgi:hypothetical protein